MLRRLLLPLLLFALVLAFAAAGNAKGDGTLKGEVYGDALFKIEMKGANGKDLKTIKAGTYKIKVEDKGTIHDFRLQGPGVNKATSITGTGDQTWTVKLKPGTYTYLCDPHRGQMRGTFKVTS
jgi:heme/copper-type cytochrome/quinol oxidase subunit 2